MRRVTVRSFSSLQSRQLLQSSIIPASFNTDLQSWRQAGISLVGGIAAIMAPALFSSAAIARVPDRLTTDSFPHEPTSQLAQDYLWDEMDYLKTTSEHWIEINLSTQRLIAWEGDRSVYAVIVSTGQAATPTPTGVFSIYTTYDVTRMQGADYDVPDVPYAMFYDGNYAIHGAYWHNNFGVPVSHGCTNVAVNHAGWLYDWAYIGSPVVVHY
jgi:hypothetical protein